jgi:outer membrane protein assembly factor BamB
MKTSWIMTGLCALLLQSCTQIDNYILGKDNTPKPSPLAPLHGKSLMKVSWIVPMSKVKKPNTYLKLKPVIRGDRVYVADEKGMVKAVDKTSGRVVWSTQLDEGFLSGPSVSDGFLALGTSRAGVVLLKQADGHQVWKTNVSSDVLSKPVIVNKKVIVKTIDGYVYAFDLLTGEKIWVADHGSPNLILKASSSPVILDNQVLVGFSDGKLEALDINFGHVLWQRSIAYASGSSDVERLVDIDADPIAREGVVYLATYQGYIGALNLQNGQFIWNKPASTYRNMAMDADTLYMTDSDDVIWAYDRRTGVVKWKQEALKARGVSEPVLMGHRLLVGDKLGYLHLLARQNGNLLSRTQLSGAIDTAPSISGQHAYVMTSNGQLNCLSVS